MNRPIKFRGRTVNGDWVYGDLRHDREGSTKYFEQCPYRICWSDGTADCNAPVVKGTVGQYTGLQDRNGIEIYEGDTVRFDDNYMSENPTQEGFVGFGNASFYIDSGYTKHYRWMDYECEVIGNIHKAEEWPCTCGDCDGEHHGFARGLPQAIVRQHTPSEAGAE